MKRIISSLLLSLGMVSVSLQAGTPGIGGDINDWGVVIDGMASVRVDIDNAQGVVVIPEGSSEPAVVADGTNYIRIPVNTPRFTVSAAKDYKLVSVKTGDRDLTITDNEAVVECTPTSVITITSMHINTGIGEIAADGIAEPVYYNLTGNRVFNPVKGSIYIVVTGNQVRKIIL